MKGLYFALIIILMLSLLLMPLCAFSNGGTQNNSDFKVYMTETAEIRDVSAFDYCLSVAANNLNKDASIETIKAEAVAAFTLALYHKNKSEAKNFDFNDSLDGFITNDKLKEKWGDDYTALYDKFSNAVLAVLGQSVLYDNKPINAIRHNISSGVTEDAKNFLSGEFPYLISVESAGDLLSEKYLTEKIVTTEEFKDTLKEHSLTFTENPEKYIEKTEKTKAGSVLKITVLGKDFGGEEFKNLFNLPSMCFDVSFKENSFVFSVKGEGTLLGLSRTGAEYMAQSGNTYTQILSWYYPGCTLKK